jgi:hypothetical protein
MILTPLNWVLTNSSSIRRKSKANRSVEDVITPRGRSEKINFLGLSLSLLSKLGQPFFNLIFGEGFLTFYTLVYLIDQFIIDKIIREIDAMKSKRKIINALEVLTLTSIT